MKLAPILYAIALFALSIGQAVGDETPSPDRVEIQGGVVMIGTIEGISGDQMRLQTDYAGTVEVDVNRIVQVSSVRPLEFDFPEWVVVLDTKAAPPPASVNAASNEEPPRTSAEVTMATTVEKKGWQIEAGLDFNQKGGNTDKLDLTTTIDAKLERPMDRLNFYGQYSYGTNRGDLITDELILGGRYNSNFRNESVGFFFREEIEFDEFEGLAFRSTTASGVSWKIRQEKDLHVEARSGLSYRFEDYIDDGSNDFPGMDFGLDVNWRATQWLRFQGSYTFLPSVDEVEDFIVVQDTGIDMPLDFSDKWKLRLGINSKYNNHPDEGRERLDFRYYARIIATWR